MANTLDNDLNIVSNSGLEIELLGDDLNIIQALDDEPNDVGGMTSAELKETFDRAGNLIKTYLNEKLVPAILADDATEAARAAAEAARVTAETARDTAEGLRSKAEEARAKAEEARVNENTGIVAQATAKATAAADSAAKALNSEGNAKSWSEGGYVSEEDADGMIQDTPVPGAKWYAEKAAAFANGGSYDPDPTDGTAERTYTSGAKNMADKAKAFAEGGSYKEYVADTSAPGTYNLVTKTVAEAESAKGYAQRAELAAIKQPIIQSGTWWVWNASSGAYTDTGVSAGGTGGGTSDQVFIAEYDVTTNADLLAAYQSGKVCFVKYGDQYVPVTIVQADYNSNFVLKGYIIIAESVPGVYVNEVNQTVIVSRYDTGWSIGNRALSIDDALSNTSENPVQNKVIKSALDVLSEEISNVGKPTDEQVSAAVNAYLDANPVSGGISTTAKNLLITILRSGVYTDDQSNNITALETALGGGTTEPEEPDVPVEKTYAISNELINCTSSNSATSAKENAVYTATLTANDGYTLTGGTVTVTMGGVDITDTAYADGVISIAAVTGDVEIFASAVAVQAEAALPEDGLIAYFDFRTTTYDNAGSGGKTTIAPTKGSGQLYAWANNCISAQNEYGLHPANPRRWEYDQNGGTNATALGDAFTVIQLTYGHVSAFGFKTSNVGAFWEFYPAYINTSGSTAYAENVNGSNFNSDNKNDYNFAVVRADGATLTEILDTSRTTYNGGDIDGFSRWLDTPYGNTVTVGDTIYCTAMAIYNRALTDSEIEAAREFMQTLEVTA